MTVAVLPYRVKQCGKRITFTTGCRLPVAREKIRKDAQ